MLIGFDFYTLKVLYINTLFKQMRACPASVFNLIDVEYKIIEYKDGISIRFCESVFLLNTVENKQIISRFLKTTYFHEYNYYHN